MDFPITNGRHHHQMIGSLLALSMLLMFAREACAECAPAAAANHPSTASRILEAACTRESVSRTLSHSLNSTNTATVGSARWSMASALSAASIVSQHGKDAELETPVQRSLSDVHWADSRDWINNPPEWVKAARNYKRQGMPIVHLLQSQDKSTLVALGVSNHGKPGLYFMRKLPY
jgi:hypothetical protein